jgi:hypothetical protein
MDGRLARARVFAVFKFPVSLKMTGRWIGRSAGISPLRIQSTYAEPHAVEQS